MMVVLRGVKEDFLGAFRRFEGSFGVFCCHAGGVWPPSDDALTMPLLRIGVEVQRRFLVFLEAHHFLMLD
jgi:hypothetical protein